MWRRIHHKARKSLVIDVSTAYISSVILTLTDFSPILNEFNFPPNELQLHPFEARFIFLTEHNCGYRIWGLPRSMLRRNI